MEWLSARFSPRAFLWDWSQDAGLTAGFRLFSGVLGGFYRMAGVRLLLLMVCMCVCGASWGGQQRYSLYAGSREQGHTGDGARAASRHRYCKGTAKAYTSINKHREGERDLLLGSLMCVGGGITATYRGKYLYINNINWFIHVSTFNMRQMFKWTHTV